MPFNVAIEMAVFIGHEGQIEMNSKLEMRLLNRLVKYLKESDISRLEHALAHIYLKSWGPNAKDSFFVETCRLKLIVFLCKELAKNQ